MDLAERFARRKAARGIPDDVEFVTRRVSTSAGSVCLRCIDVPNAKPYVFVHGIGVSGLYMLPTAAQVARTNPVFVPDLPGHGDSDRAPGVLDLDQLADVVAEVIARCRLVEPTLVGNSYGCQIAARCVRRHHGLCARLVLQAPTIEGGRRTRVRQVAAFCWNALWEPLSAGPVVLRDYAKAGTRLIFAELEDALNNAIERDLRAIDVPVLLIRGSRDRIVGPDWLEYLARESVDARLAEVAGVAHAMNFSAPERFAYLLRSFAENSLPTPPKRAELPQRLSMRSAP